MTSLALLLLGLAIPGSFQCPRDQLRKAFTDARIRPGEALRRDRRVCLRGDRGNDGRLIGINHHRFGFLAFGVDQDPGKLGTNRCSRSLAAAASGHPPRTAA